MTITNIYSPYLMTKQGLMWLLSKTMHDMLQVKTNYMCLTKAAENNRKAFKPVVAWLRFNEGVWSFTNDAYKMKDEKVTTIDPQMCSREISTAMEPIKYAVYWGFEKQLLYLRRLINYFVTIMLYSTTDSLIHSGCKYRYWWSATVEFDGTKSE
ncbi:hypothetical protein C5167_033319 [Papaver somniferum]|uniref:Uncharacterized protein n=1 Tax=Papaver somniferum TaxID=3469 RepID=A0A4Y7KCV5_PAPSO|nr:hypothetical protein C5167_033319 [Papaver somniferum]